MARTAQELPYRVYGVTLGHTPLSITLQEMDQGTTKVAVAIGLTRESENPDASEVDVSIHASDGQSLNCVDFPHAGRLPILQVGRSRSAVATFRFEPRGDTVSPRFLLLRFRARSIELDLDSKRHRTDRPKVEPPEFLRSFLPSEGKDPAPKGS